MAQINGTPYPIIKDPKGYFATTTGNKLIKGDLLQLLLTYPGERILNPSYGTPLRDLVFELNDTALNDKAKNMIINSINTWEKRVAVQDIQITNDINPSILAQTDDLSQRENILGIRILFSSFEDITEIQELVLEIPLT